MSAHARPNPPAPVGQLSIWFGLLGGIIAWIAHLFIAYAVVPFACVSGLEFILYGTIVATTLIALAALLVAWRGWTRSRNHESHEDIIRQRSAFMTLSGVALSGLFLLVIVAQSLPIFLGSPCDPAGSLRF